MLDFPHLLEDTRVIAEQRKVNLENFWKNKKKSQAFKKWPKTNGSSAMYFTNKKTLFINLSCKQTEMDV